MNKKLILRVALFIGLATPIGCRALMKVPKVPSSSFLSGFSLEQLVKNNHSPSGMLCSKGGLGGDGNRIGSAGRNGSSTSASSSFSCHLSDAAANSFDEAAFITSLKVDIERQIRDSGATINSKGSSEPTGFFIEYAERDIHGRITVNGKMTGGCYFSLDANVNEKTENASSFFSSFSTRQLVERNKSSAGLTCDPIGGGGGGGGVGGVGGGFGGSGGTHFNSHKSDSFACRLKSNDSFDETKFFAAMKLDVEHALRDNGAQITDSGSTGSANFYLAYVLKNVRGRVEISGTRIRTDYYDVRAVLEETGN